MFINNEGNAKSSRYLTNFFCSMVYLSQGWFFSTNFELLWDTSIMQEMSICVRTTTDPLVAIEWYYVYKKAHPLKLLLS